jgi:hypothetical protein
MVFVVLVPYKPGCVVAAAAAVVVVVDVKKKKGKHAPSHEGSNGACTTRPCVGDVGLLQLVRRVHGVANVPVRVVASIAGRH